MLSENDKVKFLAVLPELTEYALAQQAELTRQEIESFFEGIALTEEHYQQIYAYLLANQIQVKDGKVSRKEVQKYEKSRKEYGAGSGKKGAGKKSESQYLQMYLRDLESIPPCGKEEEQALYAGLLMGDKEAYDRLAKGKLSRVVALAKEYAEPGLVTEDLIQEGNMGLLTALSELFGMQSHPDCEGMVDDYIRQYMALAADGEIQMSDQENRILAKINLVHEAARVLAEEFGRIATIQELMDYTKLPYNEMKDILRLSEGKIEIGSGDIQ